MKGRWRRFAAHSIGAALLAIAAAGAGCGGPAANAPPRTEEPIGTTPPGSGPASGPAGSAAPPPQAEAPGATVPGPAASSGAASSSASPSSILAPTPPGAAPIVMKPPVPTAFSAELAALALDPNNLPPIEKIDPKQLRGVMKLFAKSLGARCADCHEETDFAAPTPAKRVAAKMWNEFSAKLAFQDGGALFCDSCHEGRAKELDRTDLKALSQWMDANFVAKLKRKDDGDLECETCHVNMDMHFLNKWAAR